MTQASWKAVVFNWPESIHPMDTSSWAMVGILVWRHQSASWLHIGNLWMRKLNYHQSRAHSIVERGFGVMKTCWRSTLFRALEVSPTFAPQVIASCAFLHNICIDRGDILEPDNDLSLDILDPEPPLKETPEAHEAPGNATRDGLAATLINAQAPLHKLLIIIVNSSMQGRMKRDR